MAGFLKNTAGKKTMVLALILLVLMVFYGCGKRETVEPERATASKNYVYKMQEVDLGEEGGNINQIVRAGESFYAWGFSLPDDGSDYAVEFYKLNEDGTAGEKYHIALDEYINIRSVNMDDDENIYCIKNDYHPLSQSMVTDREPVSEEYPEETDENAGENADENADEYVDENADEYEYADEYKYTDEYVEEYPEEYVDDYYFVKMNLQGEELFSVKLNDIPDFARMSEENGYLYVRDMIFDKGSGIYLNTYGKLMKFDFEGNYSGLIEDNGQPGLFDSATFIALMDGGAAAVLYEENGISVAPVDLEKGTIGEKSVIPGTSWSYSYYAGYGYDLYLTDLYGVYGYNLGDSDKTQLMSYIDSDLDVYTIYQVVGINGKDFFATYDDMETGYSVPAIFSKVPPEEVKDKQVIVLAMAGANWNVRRCAINFNKENEDYRISILDYSSLYSSDDDYMAGINRLNTDIASGKVPDVILLNESMPVESYISKGLFEDLKPYINKDEELDLDNFMPNIVEAFSVNGKMYALVPSYCICSLVAKASDVGEERGWTVQEAADLLASKPEGTWLLENVTRSRMMTYCMSMSGNQFIDWESGACSFNSDEFIQMLEFIGTFPEEIDEDIYTDDFWDHYDSMWREGRVIGSVYYFGSFRDYNNVEKGTFGEEITMIGFPSSNEDGSVIVPDMQFALSAKSGVKEGAWEFLRTFVTDKYQEENVTYSFPLSISRLLELAGEAMEKPYYIDEKGNKVEYDNTHYIGGEEITIPPMTKQETEEMMELLYSFTQVAKQDDTLQNIIEEEAAPYFAGQKSAEDVAAIIQSRVQIYVNENR